LKLAGRILGCGDGPAFVGQGEQAPVLLHAQQRSGVRSPSTGQRHPEPHSFKDERVKAAAPGEERTSVAPGLSGVVKQRLRP
jgi:hypothetical protein